MEIVLLAVGLAALVWGLALLPRASLVTMAGVYIALTAVFGIDQAGIKLGPVTATPDRFWLMAMIGVAAYRWRMQGFDWKGIGALDLAIGLFFLWLIARTLPTLSLEPLKGQPPTMMHLINGYAVPMLLAYMVRHERIGERGWNGLAIVVVVLTCYLSVTAVLEILKLWSLVWPRYIADPLLGIHFGRARGPMLQSVRLGMCLVTGLTVLLVAGYWEGRWGRTGKLMVASMAPLFVLAIGLTYTRSIWMALAATGLILSWLWLPGRWRWALIGSVCLFGAIGVLGRGSDLVAFKREYSEAETRQSTFMRACFAYVSAQMIADRPIAGFGFNQFQRENQPYLSDRSPDLQLETIRGYVHHNTFLSLAVDLGVIGLSLYLLVLGLFGLQAWELLRRRGLPRWVRGVGIVAIGGLASHLIQMAFHEVTFSPLEHALLWIPMGISVGLHRRYCVRSVDAPVVIHDRISPVAVA
jgi:O-antigen ligase